jgi:hypothetical protein
MQAANKAIAAGDYATADRQLDAAAAAAQGARDEAHLRFLVAHSRAMPPGRATGTHAHTGQGLRDALIMWFGPPS